jgi:hypothetical protein
MLAFFRNGLVMPQAFALGAIADEREVDHLRRPNNSSIIKAIAIEIAKMLGKKTIATRIKFIVR